METLTSTLKQQKENLTPKILGIFGSHPRHLYYANQINKAFPLAGAIIQQRGGMMPKQPLDISKRDARLWDIHFSNRVKAEDMYFGQQEFPDTEQRVIGATQLESKMSVDFVKEINPDIVLVFGCGMIRGDLAEVLPDLSINLHLGLSPRYRGAATLFWPFYFLEPQWAGCTFHKIVYEPDAGEILHQCSPILWRGDKIHDTAARAVIEATDDMIKLLNPNCDWHSDSFIKQTTTGKNFLSRDFQPAHLRLIYEVYDDDIVDQYLDGNLKRHKPKLVRQF